MVPINPPPLISMSLFPNRSFRLKLCLKYLKNLSKLLSVISNRKKSLKRASSAAAMAWSPRLQCSGVIKRNLNFSRYLIFLKAVENISFQIKRKYLTLASIFLIISNINRISASFPVRTLPSYFSYDIPAVAFYIHHELIKREHISYKEHVEIEVLPYHFKNSLTYTNSRSSSQQSIKRHK